MSTEFIIKNKTKIILVNFKEIRKKMRIFFFLSRKIECPSILLKLISLLNLFMTSKTFLMYFFFLSLTKKITLFFTSVVIFFFILAMIIHFIDSDLSFKLLLWLSFVLRGFWKFHYVRFNANKRLVAREPLIKSLKRFGEQLSSVILARNVQVFGDLRSSSWESYLIILLCSKSLFKRKKK